MNIKDRDSVATILTGAQGYFKKHGAQWSFNSGGWECDVLQKNKERWLKKRVF